MREVDAGIKIGATISVLGTVGITLDGMIFIEPMWIFKDRLSFLKEIESEVQSYVEKRNWWLVGFLIGGVYLARRLYHYCQKNGIVLPWLKKKPMIN